MSKSFLRPKFVFTLLLCLAVLFACASRVSAQSSTTGALTGVVTDPSGGVISGATVTLTSTTTGQVRTGTTDAGGNYKFSLIPPGTYSLKFEAAGFKTSTVPSVTVNVTETPVLNQKLEIGAQTAEVTVEATAETIQTQNATVGNLVGSETVTSLPLSSRNYTQIIDLSPGVVANVASAAAVGNGTQDINVNGFGSDQNNYMMDGATLTNYGSGGGAQSGNFPGIGIPNPDSIQEFKIQTSQYDAEYGRNPGASVNVVTKSGTNQFHGAAWEFFRNSFLDGNDFFNKRSEAQLVRPNKPEALNENLFGGTLGGPIKKDKLFFFGSYQGFRQKNGIGTNGFATGLAAAVQFLPLNEPNGKRDNSGSGTIPLNYVTGAAPCNYNTYRTYLGCVFGGDVIAPFLPFGTHVPVANDGSNINQVAINIFQAAGPKGGFNGGYYFPSVPFVNGVPVTTLPQTISVPILANEDQYLGNVDWVVTNKNTFSGKFFTSKDPQNQSFVCLGFIGAPGVNNCQPGAPENVVYTADSGTAKLTTVATSSFVNEALFSFQRSTTVAHPGVYLTACSVGIIPPIANGNCSSLSSIKNLNPIPAQIPTFGTFGFPMANANIAPGPVAPVPFAGAFNNGGNFFASATNFFNTFQSKDQISWNHGKHAIRAGAEVDRIQYNWTLPGRGGLVFPTISDFLTSSSGSPATGTAVTPGGLFINFYGLSQPNGNPHDQRTNEFAAFAEDDIKLTRKLTLNLGIRWEYDGYPSDVTGLFTDGWPTQAALVNTGSFFLGQQASNAACGNGTAFGAAGCQSNLIGTLAGHVVQSNYNPNIARCGPPSAPVACGLTAPAGVFAGYPGGATGVFFNTNKTLVHGAPIDDFGPRIGFAWQAMDKLVVRGGYGIFYDAVYANLLANNNAGNPPYSGAVPFSPFNSLDQPSPPGLILGWRPRTLQVVAGTPGTGATVITDNGRTQGLGTTSDSEFLGVPKAQQYNLDLQYEVARDWIVDVGYVGSHGTHLYDWARPINISFLAPNAPNEPLASDKQNSRMILGSGAQGTPTSFPINDAANTNPATQVIENTGTNAIGRVSYLGFGTGGLSTTSTRGDSLYNSLQAQIRHQFSHGLLVQASYTWSKLITNINSSEAGAGISAPGNVLSGGASSNSPVDFGQQYGLAAFNRPHRLIVAYSYDLPYRRMNGFAGHVFGGWTVSGITTIQNGEPFTITDGNGGRIYYGSSGVPFGGGGVRAELASPTQCNTFGVCQSAVPIATSGGVESRINGYVNPAAFANTPCIGGTTIGSCLTSGGATGFGNSAVGSISGPGQNNWDMTAIKNTKITEGLTLQFRAEFYNVWNHSQFNPPVNDRSNANFAKIFSSSVPPRVVQLAVKFVF
ncbi:MAG TPA: carboxypeptidase regulatory-like domain-containing protein [Candidatus Acidoferrales bacterium]|nr:carboxypeptidase regulatory-like domain-containing protein [Candidatus Acidoferrales bacterium]